MQPGLVTRDNIAMLIDLYELTMAASYHEHRPDDLDPSFSDSQRKAASDPSRLSPSMGPLVTGEELIRELFTRAGNPVCHTIPGIEGAEGRVGPKLVMRTTGPQRLADPRYRGRAKTVKEYLIESILEPGAYLVPGYLDQTVSWWYGQKLMAGALEKIATYLQQITEESPSSQWAQSVRVGLVYRREEEPAGGVFRSRTLLRSVRVCEPDYLTASRV